MTGYLSVQRGDVLHGAFDPPTGRHTQRALAAGAVPPRHITGGARR